MNQQNYLPKDGTVVSINSSENYIGKTQEPNKNIQLSKSNGQTEAFAIQTDGNKFALRQVLSGLYLGGMIQDGKNPMFVKKRDAWEMFVLQHKGHQSGGEKYTIKSQDNTYLCYDQQKLVWKSNPSNGNEVWVFHIQNEAPHDFKQGFSSQGTQGIGYKNGKLDGYLQHWFQNIGKDKNLFPIDGEQVILRLNNTFIGAAPAQNQQIIIAPQNKEWGKLIVEVNPDGTYSFKQKVSGLYFGSEIASDKTPRWAPHKKQWEKFTLELEKNNTISIKSYQNTYLTHKMDKVIWFKIKNGLHYWKFERLNAPVQGQGFNAGGFNAQQTNQVSLPSVGNIITFGQENQYVGGINKQSQSPIFVNKAQAWEEFEVLSAPDGKVSFKQTVSNLFLGGQIANGKNPILVPKAQDWEYFTLQNRGNGGFAIKSHTNTYLTKEDGKLIWRDKPEGGKQVWNFSVVPGQGK